MSIPRGDTDYLGFMRFVKNQPCCVTGTYRDIEAAHFRGLPARGMNGRPTRDYMPRRVDESKYLAVPLTRAEHELVHELGERGYCEARGITRAWLIGVSMKLLVSYHRGRVGMT